MKLTLLPLLPLLLLPAPSHQQNRFSPFSLFESLFNSASHRNRLQLQQQQQQQQQRPNRHLRRPSSNIHHHHHQQQHQSPQGGVLRAPTPTPFKASPTIPNLLPLDNSFRQSNDVRIILPDKTSHSTLLPSQSFQENSILPSQSFQENSILTSQSFQENSVLPLKTFQESPVLPLKTFPESPVLPLASVKENSVSPIHQESGFTYREPESTTLTSITTNREYSLPSSFVEILDNEPVSSSSPSPAISIVLPSLNISTPSKSRTYHRLEPILPYQKSEASGPNPDLGGGSPVLSSNYYYDELVAPIPDQSVPVAPLNPYYAPEEFTYNQEPIDLENIVEDSLPPKLSGLEKLVVDLEGEEEKEEEKEEAERFDEPEDIFPYESFKIIPRGIGGYDDIDSLFREDGRSSSSSSSSSLLERPLKEARSIDSNSIHVQDLDDKRRSDLNLELDCGGASDLGFCAITSTYPANIVDFIVDKCRHITDAFTATVDDNIEELGDNSPVANSKETSGAWSWKVYSYKKKQVCNSQLYFIRPGLALDTKGSWYTIVQTDNIVQRVGIDMCHSPNSPCPGIESCGSKSRCVQRYNYQYLLSAQTDKPSRCPAIRAFKFPSGCVCHMEV